MWAVLYDDGMSLTCASEQIARTLAEAERQRGRRVTVQRIDDADSVPEPEPIREREPASAVEPAQAAEPVSAPEPAPEPTPAAEPVSAPEPASEASAPTREPEPARPPEPALAPTYARRRRLLIYALAAAGIIAAAVLAGHWGVLPSVGANSSSSPTQAGAPNYQSQLLPPLNQPPVMHFSTATDESSGVGPSPTARGG
jgi:hypothetical protein